MHRSIGPLLVLALLGACADQPTQPHALPSSTPDHVVIDAANGGGAPGFYFLSPIAAGLTSYPGLFDGGAEPVVEICRWTGAACDGPPLATYSRTAGKGGVLIQVNTTNEFYRVDWPIAGLPAGGVYRVRTLQSGEELGVADLKKPAEGETATQVRQQGYIPIGNSSTFPIRFRIQDLPPVAAITVGEAAAVGQPVALSGAASTDERALASYAWDLDGDDEFDDAVGVDAAFVCPAEGSFRVALRVADGAGQTSTATATVECVTPPVAGQIAFLSSEVSRTTNGIFRVDADGTGRVWLANTSLVHEPYWSPDGSRIAFRCQHQNNEVCVMDADGGNLVQLTSLGGADPGGAPAGVAPRWSPDGTRIAFVRFFFSGTAMLSDLYVVNADGGGFVQLTNQPGQETQPDWSPDGRRIAYTCRDGSLQNVCVVNADGGGQTQLTSSSTGQHSEPRWSPDGTRIAFTSNRGVYFAPCGSTQVILAGTKIHVMNADGSGDTMMTGIPCGPSGQRGAFHSGPLWSPDGTRIAFYNFAFTTDVVNHADIFVVDAAVPGALTNVSNTPGSEVGIDWFAYQWSPDGGRISFVGPGGGGVLDEEVYVVNPDGSGRINVSQNPSGGDRAHSWSPDGERLVFASSRTGAPGLYVVNRDGSGLTRITDNGWDSAPQWRPRR